MTMTTTLAGRRILVLVPHPDDEVVGCAAAIGRARAPRPGAP
jgi:LmbE family N-acetylglucosaminyl deacetylase